MCGLFEDVVTLVSHTGLHGIVEWHGRRYLIQLGTLVHIEDNKYCINIGELTIHTLLPSSKG